MKTKLFLLMLLAASTLSAQNKLTVVIDGIENMKGQLVIGLYDEAGFMKKRITSKIQCFLFEKNYNFDRQKNRICYKNY